MTENKVAELKPCPFCGGKLIVYSEAKGYLHPKGNCPLADFEMLADGYSEDRWNTRIEASQAGAGVVDEPMRDALVLARRIIEGVNKRYPIGAYSDDLRTIDEALTTPTRIEAAKTQEVVDGLREALGKCRDRFEEYVTSHYEKGTPDGNAKAVRNAEMVELCEKALTTPTRIEAARAIEIGRKLDAEDGGYPPPIQAAGDVEKMKVLLPPASVDQEFLDGWISGQQYLILNYGSKEEFDEAVATPPQAAESGLLDEAVEALRECRARMWSNGPNTHPLLVKMDAILAKAGKPQP